LLERFMNSAFGQGIEMLRPSVIIANDGDL